MDSAKWNKIIKIRSENIVYEKDLFSNTLAT